jgi:hypothetical protein
VLWLSQEVLGALASVLSIWLVTGILVYEAIDRIINPVFVNGKRESRFMQERSASLVTQILWQPVVPILRTVRVVTTCCMRENERSNDASRSDRTLCLRCGLLSSRMLLPHQHARATGYGTA